MRVLRVPGFAPLLAGQAISAIGNWVALTAIWGFAAYKFDADAGDLALLIVTLSVPGALFGPLLGVWIDRLGPRRAFILANVLGFLNALALTRADSYEQVILLALPLGLIEAIAMASLDAIPPRLVPDDGLVAANALLGGAQDVAIILGPVLAAVVNAHWGLAGAFATDAATFLVAIGVAFGLRVGPVTDREERPARHELLEGFGLVRRIRGLRWTLTVAAITYSLWALFGVLEPLYVRDVLAESDTMFALFQTAFGLGLAGTGLVLATVGDRVAKPRNVALATVLSGLTAALYLGTQSVPIAFVGVFLWGIDVAFFYVPAKTLLQRYAPVHAHGRVLAVNHSIEPAMAIFVTPLAAFALGTVGVQTLGVAGGLVAACFGIVALVIGRSLAAPPPGAPGTDQAGVSARDAIALGGQAPG